MSPEVSERSFEAAIECGLLEYGPDACAGDPSSVREVPPAYGDTPPGGYLLKSFVELHPHAIAEKARVIVEHFAAQVQSEVGGKAKAMIVTRSRLHAVRFKLAFDRYVKEKGYPFQALVAFSGAVDDGGDKYTESGMNSLGKDRSIGEAQTCLLYTSDAADDLLCVDLGGRRIIKKKK